MLIKLFLNNFILSRNKYIILLLFGFMALMQPSVQASHFMGSDMRFDCINGSNDSFLVTVTVYRDCRGIPINTTNPTPGGLRLEDMNGSIITGQAGTVTPLGLSVDCDDITPVCGTQCTQCGDGNTCNNLSSGSGAPPGCTFSYGIERYTYEYLIVFNSNFTDCEVRASIQANGYRNSDISTGAANAGYYTDVMINRCQDPCNSSPEFGESPIAVICQNQDFIYNQGAVDFDVDSNGAFLDSLSFELTPPLQNFNSPTSWTGGYDHENPLQYFGFNPNNPNSNNLPKPRGFHLDPVTGDLQFNPRALQSTVISIKVTEYRNGEKIGYTKRDLQIIVINCPSNRPPEVSGFNGSDDNFFEEVCAGEEANFFFTSGDPDTPNISDPDLFDTVTMSFNRGNLPGSPSWSDNDNDPDKVQFPTGYLRWTPTDADASRIPYFFTIRVEDDACPVVATTIRSYRLRVKPRPQADVDIDIGNCGEVEFTATPRLGVGITYEWLGEGEVQSVMRTFTHQYPGPGSYPLRLELTAQECTRTYEDTVVIDPFITPTVFPSDTLMCYGDDLELTSSVRLNEGPVKYFWSTGDTTSSTIIENVTENKTITLEVEDDVCNNSRTVPVRVRELPLVDVGPDRRLCSDDEIVLNPIMVASDSVEVKPESWFSVIRNMQVSEDSSYTITGADSGLFIFSASDTLGCINSDTLEVFINPSIEATANPREICLGDSSLLRASITGGGTAQYEWTRITPSGEVFVADSFQVRVSPTQTSKYILRVTEEVKGVTCFDVDTFELVVHPLPDITFDQIGPYCQDADEENLNSLVTTEPAQGGLRLWYINDERFQNGVRQGNRVAPNNFPEEGGVYPLYFSFTETQQNCTRIDSVPLEILPLPEVSVEVPTDVCLFDGEIPLVGEPEGGTWTGLGVREQADGSWVFNTNGLFTGPGEYNLQYTYESAEGCANDTTVSIRVLPAEEIEMENNIQVCIGDTIPLEATPEGGEWKFIDGEETQLILNDYYIIEEAGDYRIAYYVDVEGICESFDTMEVRVNPLPELDLVTSSGRDEFCETEENILFQDMLTNKVGEETWFTDAGEDVMSANSFDATKSGPGSFWVYSRFELRTGCAATDSIRVRIRPIPEVDIRTDAEQLCEEEATEFNLEANVANAEGVTWEVLQGGGSISDEGATMTSYIPSVSDYRSGGEVTIMLSSVSSLCPTVYDTIKLRTYPTPRASFESPVLEECTPFTFNLENNSTSGRSDVEITEYAWDFGDGNISGEEEPTHTYEESGGYDVKLVVENSGGCRDTLLREEYLFSSPTPIARFDINPAFTTIVTPLVEFRNETQTSLPTTFKWNFDDFKSSPDGVESEEENPEHEYVDTGLYMVTLVAENEVGCIDTFQREVNIRPDVLVHVPNVFTPNDDGRNDELQVVASGIIGFDFSIYNRWGERLYHSDDYEAHSEEGWNGRYNGAPVPEGVYVYKLVVRSETGREYKYSGTITVLLP